MAIIVASMEAVPDRAEDLARILGDAAEQAAKEPGVVAYSVTRRDEVHFLVFEHYADKAALDAHINAPYVQEMMGSFRGLLAGKPGLEFYELIAGFPK